MTTINKKLSNRLNPNFARSSPATENRDQEGLPFVRKFQRKNFPSNGSGIFLGTEIRNRIEWIIELYHLQNTGKVLAFSRHEAWH